MRKTAFLLGYAHEALARAEFLAGNTEKAKEHLAEAFRQAEKITEAEEQGIVAQGSARSRLI